MQIYIWHGTLNQNIVMDGYIYLDLQIWHKNIDNVVYYGKTLLDSSSNVLLNILLLHFQMTKLMMITFVVVLVLSIVEAANVERKG